MRVPVKSFRTKCVWLLMSTKDEDTATFLKKVLAHKSLRVESKKQGEFFVLGFKIPRVFKEEYLHIVYFQSLKKEKLINKIKLSNSYKNEL